MKTIAVLDSKPITPEIIKKCEYALENKTFRKKIKNISNPYYMPNSSLKISNLILNTKYNLNKILLKKFKFNK